MYFLLFVPTSVSKRTARKGGSSASRFLQRVPGLIILFFIPYLLNAQTVTGLIYKAGSETPVPQASVYYGGSMAGTLTNDQGEFTLQAKQGQTPIIVSCVGYYSSTILNYVAGQPLKVYLDPKTYVLKPVVISEDGMSREDKVRLFMREFIGTSDYALSCTIKNIDDLDLRYSKKTNTLTASSYEPIQIENKKLGYHITYFLDRFSKTPTNTSFRGNFIMREIQGSDPDQIVHNREDSYQGSRMQLIRALWRNNLEAAGFKLYTNLSQPLPADSIVSLTPDSERVINLRSRAIISYKKGNSPKNTYLMQTRRDSYIDSSGFYDTTLRWGGFMTAERVGDMLPFEYQSSSELRDNVASGPEITPYRTKLSSEILRIKSIVLAPASPVDHRLVVKKWQRPVFYKAYGNFGLLTTEKLDQKLRMYFKQISNITGLNIQRADDDSKVNFFILAGDNPTKYSKYIGAGAVNYLKRRTAGGSYHVTQDEEFIKTVLLVALPNRPGMGDPSADIIWSALQKHLIRGFGFLNNAEDEESSLFYNRLVLLPDKISASDSRVIKALYNPGVKSGMDEPEFEKTLINAP